MSHQRKIAFIGAGNVGMSCLYACVNRGLADEYGIMDYFDNVRDGNVMDLEDVRYSVGKNYHVKAYTYQDLLDVDYLVITAGTPQKPGQTRLEMVDDNLKIIKSIAESVKSSGFKGITILASNPVDVLTYAYIKYTGFCPSKVLGSGTMLDTARLVHEISADLKVHPRTVDAYVLGEHGDSSLVAFSQIRVGGLSFQNFESRFTDENYETELESKVAHKAYEIIERKRATFYGIGAAMARLIETMVRNEKTVLVVGALIDGEYNHKDVVFGTPCLVSGKGIEKVLEVPLNEKEREKLQKSVEILQSYNEKITE